MSEPKYVVLDVNQVPMIYRSVHGKIVKCFLNRPVGFSSLFSPNLFLTKEEVMSYDERLLDFCFTLERSGIYGIELKKAF